MISPTPAAAPPGDNASTTDLPAAATVFHLYTDDIALEDDGPLGEVERLIAAGDRAGAIAHAVEAAAREDERPSTGLVTSLAHCLIELGEPAQAAALIEPLAAAGQANPRALVVLARAMSLAGRHQEALGALNEASLLDGRSATVLLALGAARMAADDFPRAIGDFERVLRLSTGDGERDANERAEAHFRLGEAWAAMDEPARAARHFKASQADDPADRRGAGIRLAELDAQPAPTRASAAYVRALFDGYAPRYDGHMRTALSYRGPEILLKAAEAAGLSAGGPYAAIDLGCGTGLSGAAFHAHCASLTGVDLSPRMCAAAEASGFYTRVVAGDLLKVLDEGNRFGLAIACDTMIYLGDLAPLFSSLASALVPRGWFVFSTEKSDGQSEEASARGFEVGPARRFRHTETYLRTLAERHGFEVVSMDVDALRTEKRVPVESFIGVMRKS
ncbi:Methyltransferase type 12 [Parvibaculum lavamentivorans DS-1]|uniref:Methyltransferase type 12 n=1 Tax=Parvibaculum lavamentivorans (strain DS-1 / DSM 13023 / NCIMB 13966) TaxID=402881 RepID=A7HQC9_PARL1|nr:methyltransferase domain-containing protein [Parvibaculum lavamentivorans]ABS62112.1 Methyltransferase type 12 [Parvibaculum lavamentivorans DS-1]